MTPQIVATELHIWPGTGIKTVNFFGKFENVDVRNDQGYTLLHEAVQQGHLTQARTA